MKVQIINKSKNPLPSYATDGSAAMDIYANDNGLLRLGEKMVVATGLFLAIPEGYEIQIRPRSGLAARSGITVLNSPATIDSDYRGEIGVILINHSYSEFQITKGDRIAQMVLSPVFKIDWEPVIILDETDRGVGGYGSTGT